MQFTVKDLKDKLKKVPDDAVVNIERVEDIYFNTPDNGWETTRHEFIPSEPGLECTDYFPAFSSFYAKKTNNLVIVAHY